MLTSLPPSKIFLCADGCLRVLPLSTKFGEIELGEIYQLAQAQNWHAETLQYALERARFMVDSGCGSLKEQALLELAESNQVDYLDGIDYWSFTINPLRAATVYLNLETESIEVTIIDLQRFIPIWSQAITTFEQLQDLTVSHTIFTEQRMG